MKYHCILNISTIVLINLKHVGHMGSILGSSPQVGVIKSLKPPPS